MALEGDTSFGGISYETSFKADTWANHSSSQDVCLAFFSCSVSLNLLLRLHAI